MKKMPQFPTKYLELCSY